MSTLPTTEKLDEFAADCLEGPGDPAMIAPLLKTSKVIEAATDAELGVVSGGPGMINLVLALAPEIDGRA